MFVEWPWGCRYWANTRVVQFLKKYGFTFADCDGCMYGLIAAKSKEAGMPINKPWRAAYLNSSLGNRLNKKCDGSHIHTPCSGQNTSTTEGYTPTIVSIVHECFRDDVRKNSFDVPKYASAAVQKYVDSLDVPKHDSVSVPKCVNHSKNTAAICQLNPVLEAGIQSWTNLLMASWPEEAPQE